jgi:Putative restriction endonuclease
MARRLPDPPPRRHERFTKRRRYQEARVPLYWIVDGEEGQVEVWTPEVSFPQIERARLLWQPEGTGVRSPCRFRSCSGPSSENRMPVTAKALQAGSRRR